MAIERTFSIIKPDATARNLTGAINALIEKAGLRIVAQKRIRMTREQAETFYAVHKERPFFRELVEFMISGPVVVQVLEGENAVLRHREVMGATDPAKAADGTIRKLHAKSFGENSVHGSDAPETAAIEIAQFFSANLIAGEKLCDFDRGRFRGIGAMDRVFADRFRVQLADRALIRLRGIGRAHDIAVLQHCIFALENLDHDRTGNHEIDQLAE